MGPAVDAEAMTGIDEAAAATTTELKKADCMKVCGSLEEIVVKAGNKTKQYKTGKKAKSGKQRAKLQAVGHECAKLKADEDRFERQAQLSKTSLKEASEDECSDGEGDRDLFIAACGRRIRRADFRNFRGRGEYVQVH